MSLQEPTDPERDYNKPASEFKQGQRVELHPGCDRWMQGAKYGSVQRTNQAAQVFVRLDLTGKVEPFPSDRLRHVRY